MAEASLVIWKDWGGVSEECGSVLHLASAHSSQRV